MSTNEIARHGDLVWSAEAEDAGPYLLGDWLCTYATFLPRSK